jgi:hypothetical protein
MATKFYIYHEFFWRICQTLDKIWVRWTWHFVRMDQKYSKITCIKILLPADLLLDNNKSMLGWKVNAWHIHVCPVIVYVTVIHIIITSNFLQGKLLCWLKFKGRYCRPFKRKSLNWSKFKRRCCRPFKRP